MKSFSPLKPLIAALLCTASAFASAAFTPPSGTSSASNFTVFQDFSVGTATTLNSFSFFGTSDKTLGTDYVVEIDVDYFDPLNADGSTIGVEYSDSVSYLDGAWTLSFEGVTAMAPGQYQATVYFDGNYGNLNMATMANNQFASYISGSSSSGKLESGTSFKYALNDVVPVSAVPEPESYAMMLVGLGLMGAILRRRSRKSAEMAA